MTPTVEQKLAALHHVLYEMEMFVDLPVRCDMTVLQNAIAESYLIHARVLCDFFQKDDRYHDDVICADFEFPSSPLGVPEDIERRFNKSLAHLTYARLNFKGDAEGWISNQFRPHLLTRIRKFLLHLVAKPVLGRPGEIQRAQSL